MTINYDNQWVENYNPVPTARAATTGRRDINRLLQFCGQLSDIHAGHSAAKTLGCDSMSTENMSAITNTVLKSLLLCPLHSV